MSKLLVKYWAGWITSENIDNPGYLDAWRDAALKAEAENMQLVVFRIPLNRVCSMADPEKVYFIERYLQGFEEKGGEK